MKTPRIVVVGSVNVDMVVKSARIPVPGETTTGGKFASLPGGKGANQAVAAARLGAHVTLIAKVGDDVFGHEAIEGYRQEGIETDCIFCDHELPTGVALILVDNAGENLISCAPGANSALTPADIIETADIIRSADALLLQLEIPLETVLAAADIAADAGVPVILDPAPAPAIPLPSGLYRCASFMTPNEIEASQLTGLAVRDELSAAAAAEHLRSASQKCVIITLGRAGAFFCSADDRYLVPGFKVKACDTTAAGDAFNAGFAVALGAGGTTFDAITQGCAAGALAASRLGAQSSLPTRDDLKRFIRENALPLSPAK
jgi:ribokinase